MFIPSSISFPILQELLVLIRSPLTSRIVAQRALIIFYQYSFVDLLHPKSVAELVGVSPATASKHLRRFEESVEAIELVCKEADRKDHVEVVVFCPVFFAICSSCKAILYN